MAKPSFRVYWTEHHGAAGTKLSAVLLRRREMMFDVPPPAAIGDDEDEILTELERQVIARRAGDDELDLTRYLWTETFEARRIEVEVHPQTAVGAVRAIASRSIPLRLGVAVCAIDDGGWRAMLPRAGWSLVVEDLDILPEMMRQVVFAALLGEDASWIYDFRRDGDERVTEWAPPLTAELSRGHRKADEDDDGGVLPQIAEDWVDKVARKRLPPTVGPSPVFDGLVPLLDRERPPSLLLVGPSGAGKTTVVRRIARHLLDRGRGRDAKRRRLWATSADRIVAGMIYLGMWQERCLDLIRALSGSGHYLHVDRLADLVRPQSDGASIADLLAPAVIAGDVALIAECSAQELERSRRRVPELVDAFTIVRVDALDPAHAVPLVALYQDRKGPARDPTAPSEPAVDRAGAGPASEEPGAPGARSSIDVHPEAARRAVALLDAFRRDVAFPGKLFTFLDWWNQDTEPPRGLVLPRDVVAAYARWSGLPVALIAEEQPATAADVAGALRRGVIGQDHACAIAGRVVARLKAGLDDPERPVGTLLLVGPTGVGKTELAKQLATYLFGAAERLVRIDCSEYMTPGAAHRLLEAGGGAPSLAERVRAQPLSVVLLDEIEKAHAEVFDLLLGVLGEGRLTDSLGRLCDFRMAVIVMTSNLGARESKATGFAAQPHADYVGAVRGHFRPELLGRIDHVVSFQPLAPADILRIVDLEIDKVRRRAGLAVRRISLRLTGAAREALAAAGFDARLGARPLRRLIEEVVVTPLAVRMAADPGYRDREVVVAADAEPGDLTTDPIRV
jgi:ATP-dependent Clp protease ATP-binding subunit ClpC